MQCVAFRIRELWDGKLSAIPTTGGIHEPRSRCPCALRRRLDKLQSSRIDNSAGEATKQMCLPRTLSFKCKSSKKHSFVAAGSSIEYAETRHGATSSRKRATSEERDLVIGDFKLRVVARGACSTQANNPKFLFHLSPFLSFSIDD